jgi:hypothetical protein
MKAKLALSTKQPWAWLICKGFKDVENRIWGTKFRGRIYIHAGLSRDEMNKQVLASVLRILNNRQAAELMLQYQISEGVPVLLRFGAIIGEVDILDCVTESRSPWFVGPYGFTLANPSLYKKPIPCKGRLGFFEIPERVLSL